LAGKLTLQFVSPNITKVIYVNWALFATWASPQTLLVSLPTSQLPLRKGNHLWREIGGDGYAPAPVPLPLPFSVPVVN